MKIVMYSNYINHHQLPLAESFNKLPNVEYIFVATTPFNEKRKSMGYKDDNDKYDFVIRTYDSKKQETLAHHLALEADIVIVGSAPDAYMAERLNDRKITFHSSERYFKKGISLKTFPRYFASTMKHIRPYQNKPLYYLCSSAYTAKDVNTFTNFKNRCFKWGYFTEMCTSQQNIEMNKTNVSTKPIILWAGRFLSWKHPDVAIRTAYRLKQNGYDFQLNIIGGGELEEELKKLTLQLDVNKDVNFLGFLPPEQVRSRMENADIFLFTSDFNEGWGAVLNESMSSGCATIASHACGASPFLIRDGINGFLYRDGNETQLFDRVRTIIEDRDLAHKLGTQAYRDMISLWSPKIAAERLIQLNEAIKCGNADTLYSDGPCSPAPIINNEWYK